MSQNSRAKSMSQEEEDDEQDLFETTSYDTPKEQETIAFHRSQDGKIVFLESKSNQSTRRDKKRPSRSPSLEREQQSRKKKKKTKEDDVNLSADNQQQGGHFSISHLKEQATILKQQGQQQQAVAQSHRAFMGAPMKTQGTPIISQDDNDHTSMKNSTLISISPAQEAAKAPNRTMVSKAHSAINKNKEAFGLVHQVSRDIVEQFVSRYDHFLAVLQEPFVQFARLVAGRCGYEIEHFIKDPSFFMGIQGYGSSKKGSIASSQQQVWDPYKRLAQRESLVAQMVKSLSYRVTSNHASTAHGDNDDYSENEDPSSDKQEEEEDQQDHDSYEEEEDTKHTAQNLKFKSAYKGRPRDPVHTSLKTSSKQEQIPTLYQVLDSIKESFSAHHKWWQPFKQINTRVLENIDLIQSGLAKKHSNGLAEQQEQADSDHDANAYNDTEQEKKYEKDESGYEWIGTSKRKVRYVRRPSSETRKVSRVSNYGNDQVAPSKKRTIRNIIKGLTKMNKKQIARIEELQQQLGNSQNQVTLLLKRGANEKAGIAGDKDPTKSSTTATTTTTTTTNKTSKARHNRSMQLSEYTREIGKLVEEYLLPVENQVELDQIRRAIVESKCLSDVLVMKDVYTSSLYKAHNTIKFESYNQGIPLYNLMFVDPADHSQAIIQNQFVSLVAFFIKSEELGVNLRTNRTRVFTNYQAQMMSLKDPEYEYLVRFFSNVKYTGSKLVYAAEEDRLASPFAYRAFGELVSSVNTQNMIATREDDEAIITLASLMNKT